MPWLEPNLSVERHLVISPEQSLRAAQELLDNTLRELARVLQAHLELEQLVRLLNEDPTPFVGQGVSGLAEIAICLEERIAVYKQRLDQIGSRERNAAEFLTDSWPLRGKQVVGDW
jgi:hypothetical protein